MTYPDSRLIRRLRARQKKMAEDALQAHIDTVWAERERCEGWENVMRVHRYLAKRRIHDAGGDPSTVKVFMPSLGPKATPSNVIKSLIDVDTEMRAGFMTPVRFEGNTAVPVGRDERALPHDDTTVGPYDGPMAGREVAAMDTGANIPSLRSKTLKEKKP